MPAPIIALGYGPNPDPSIFDPTTPVGNVFTLVTSDGQALIARHQIGQLSFIPTHFAVGISGFDTYNPRQATIPDPMAIELENEVYRSPIERFDAPTDTSLAIVCRIPPNTIRFGIGELGVFVKLLTVNNNMLLPLRSANLSIGDSFLFSLSHMPMRCITPDQANIHRVIVDL